MKAKELLCTKVQWYRTLTQTTADRSETLLDTINAMKTDEGLKNIVEMYRSGEIDKPSCPSFMPSCECGIDKSDIIKYTNIFVLDIDNKNGENESLANSSEKVRFCESLKQVPYVLGIFTSVGGKGLFAIIGVDDLSRLNQMSYAEIRKEWHDKYGVDLDKNCSNVNRVRVMTYDENAWVRDENDDIELLHIMEIEPPKFTYKVERFGKCTSALFDSSDFVDKMCCMAINNGLLDCSSYNKWINVASIFANISNGECYFDMASQRCGGCYAGYYATKRKFENIQKSFGRSESEGLRIIASLVKRMFGGDNRWVEYVKQY